MPEPDGTAHGHRLIVLRHGPAEEEDPTRWPDDARRPLSEEGREDVARACRGLAVLLDRLELVAASPATRAESTAEILREALAPTPRFESWPELAPGMAAEAILRRVGRASRPGHDLVVVGHAPTLAELVGYALIGDAIPLVRLARGGAACVEFPAYVRPGGGFLSWLLSRKQLSGLRR